MAYPSCGVGGVSSEEASPDVSVDPGALETVVSVADAVVVGVGVVGLEPTRGVAGQLGAGDHRAVGAQRGFRLPAKLAVDPHVAARETIVDVDGTPMQGLIARLDALIWGAPL